MEKLAVAWRTIVILPCIYAPLQMTSPSSPPIFTFVLMMVGAFVTDNLLFKYLIIITPLTAR